MHGASGSHNVVRHVPRRAEAAGESRNAMTGKFQHRGEHLFHFREARIVIACRCEPSDLDGIGLKQLPGGVDAIDSKIREGATPGGEHRPDVVQLDLDRKAGME